MRTLTSTTHPDLLVGAIDRDDAAVWRIDDARALVATVDVITPLVDDARTWGRIAATNAASDVYAMGGTPLFGLNIVGWNEDELPLSILGDVLAGASEAASDGGWVIAGGHTIDDPEPKFGLAVIGLVDPDRMLTASGFRDGDALVLTKAIGVGVIATAIKQDRADGGIVETAVASMTRSNADAARVAVASGASGATDVTGFGLLGHLRNAIDGSGVDAEIEAEAVPLLPGARDLAAGGMIPGGTRNNLDWVSERIDAAPGDDLMMLLLADAQTSGGLLFGASPEEAERAVEELRTSGHAAAVIGHVQEGDGRIRVC